MPPCPHPLSSLKEFGQHTLIARPGSHLRELVVARVTDARSKLAAARFLPLENAMFSLGQALGL